MHLHARRREAAGATAVDARRGNASHRNARRPTLAYTARAGTITLRNGQDQPTPAVFYTAYTVDGKPSRRPVTFVYNGGPGSSTMWLRMGSFGPVRVATRRGNMTGPPPYRVVDNRYTLLDTHGPRLHRHAGKRLRAYHRRGHAKRFLGRRPRRRRIRTVHPALSHATSTGGTRRVFSSANRTARCARASSRSTCRIKASGSTASCCSRRS